MRLTMNGGYGETIAVKDLPVGVLGVIKYSEDVPHYNGLVVLRVYGDRLISLSDPEKTWNDADRKTFRILPLPKGATITLTQE